MANKKNKKYCARHRRHVFQKAKHAKPAALKLPQKQGTSSMNESFDGSRIVNLDKLQGYVNDLTLHAARCDGNVSLIAEKRNGLASIISTKCNSCDHIIKLETSRKVKGPRNYYRWECNLAAVWGQMSTGGGHAKLQETMGVLGVPVMSPNQFVSTERDIGEWWRREMEQVMVEAGKEEKRLAEERGDFHDGVPAISVILDGGWSKRSHRHSYNAKSGVGVIIGQETGKILFIGVRNKYCTACKQGVAPENHTCYKNWTKSSSEMEADIILDGFKQAESVHGVRYTRFIGDGDSSVEATLVQGVPVWGRYIRRLECANHACKCYRSSLEKLVQEKTSFKGKGGLTKRMRCRLTSAARCAIKMRSKEPDKKKAVKLLQHDLQNGPYHCFGQHQRCSSDFCLSAAKTSSSSQPHGDLDNDSEDDDDGIHLDDIECKKKE